MLLTIESLLKEPAKVQAVIDRLGVQLRGEDNIVWKNYLDPKRANPDGTFKTYSGTATGVFAGSIIDKNAGKPLHKRRGMKYGYGEVAYLGDKFQMDNDRLSELQVLIDTFNEKGDAATVNEIVNFLVDDYRECVLAPHKRMVLMLLDLMFKGESEISATIGKDMVKVNKIELPLDYVDANEAEGGYPTNLLLGFLESTVNAWRSNGRDASILQMNPSTFGTLTASTDFKTDFIVKFGSYEGAGRISAEMANLYLEAVQLPFRIKVLSQYIEGTSVIPNGYISAIPNAKLGNLRWVKPYELVDKIPGKNYTELENGHYIASSRDEEGRYMEYGAAMIVDIDKPDRMGLIKISVDD